MIPSRRRRRPRVVREHDRHGVESSRLEMGPRVLLEVIFPPEALPAVGTGKGSETAVDALVACEFFISSECFSAVFLVAFEWTFACGWGSYVENR